MKKLFFAAIMALIFTSCGVGSYSVSSGVADQGAVSFVSKKSFPITVIIDGKEYNVMSVKDKAYKADRKIKRTAKNTIKVSTGQHEIKVMAANDIIYSKKIFVSLTTISISYEIQFPSNFLYRTS